MRHSQHPTPSPLNKTNKQHLAIANLMNTLKQINLNQSWKQSSLKQTHKSKNPYNNLMTQTDLDALFSKSKEKSKEKQSKEMYRAKIKTEIGENCQLVKYHSTVQSRNKKDFTNTKFLKMDSQYDKLLTGLPNGGYTDKENIYGGQSGDLTTKFKKDYIIGKVIGEGAYASVRVAVYRPQNKKIAIKAYQKSKIREAVRKRTIRRQIKILQLTNHPNIVKIYDVVQSNNHLNIIMQYLPGISLSHCMKQQPHQKFTQHQCRNIMKQLANALCYLHGKNIAHRDIKLENIIIDGEMGIKLIDFGFSTCIEKGTKIKIFCGTPSYMAPEIVQKQEYRGQAADIWALGVMMFVMLIGYFPYKGSTDEELYRKINHADYPQHDISCMRRAHHLIARMFSIDAGNRITAAEILSHPWIVDSPMDTTTAVQDLQRKSSKVSSYDIKKLYNSKEKSSSKDPKDYYRQFVPKVDRGDSYSRQKKKSTQKGYLTNLNKTHKTLSGKLAATIKPPNKLERTIANPLRADKSPKSPSNVAMNRVKIMDFLKLQLKRCSDSLSPVRSHRP